MAVGAMQELGRLAYRIGFRPLEYWSLSSIIPTLELHNKAPFLPTPGNIVLDPAQLKNSFFL